MEQPITDVYHEGEIAVQERAGVRDSARKVGRIIGGEMPQVAAAFVAEQTFAVAGFADAAGHVWASLLTGEPGFLEPVSETALRVNARPAPGEPLAERLAVAPDGFPLGLLLIDFLERKRMRANGFAEPTAGGFIVRLAEVYSNCPKYIQQRVVETFPDAGDWAVRRGDTLTEHQRAWITDADTFFIASHHPQRGVDASHRGGMPGFVHVPDARTLVFPDYVGNRMFNTLGNLAVSPEAGLLFMNWETGASLLLSGVTEILWGDAVADAEDTVGVLAGAQGRAVRFTLREWREVAPGSGSTARLSSHFVSYSPFNPAG